MSLQNFDFECPDLLAPLGLQRNPFPCEIPSAGKYRKQVGACSWRAVEDPTSTPALLENPQHTLPRNGTPHRICRIQDKKLKQAVLLHQQPPRPEKARLWKAGPGAENLLLPPLYPPAGGTHGVLEDVHNYRTQESDGAGVSLPRQ